jgi:hypothetical protein
MPDKKLLDEVAHDIKKLIISTTQLFGLPDIGDPFDVRAFQSFTIPDERNAFVVFDQAADWLKPLVTTSKEERERINLHLTRRWSAPISKRLPNDGTDEPGLLADAARAAPEIRAGSVDH